MKRFNTLIAIAAICLIALSGCVTRKVTDTVYIDSYHTDTVRTTMLRVDSVWLHDSVSVMQKGDTVLVTKFRDRFRYRNLTDTVYKSKTDTVTNVKEVTVEKKPSKLSQVQFFGTGMLWGAFVGIVLCGIIYLIRKKRWKD